MHRALLGVQELSWLFGISKQTFGMRLKQEYWKDFPEPIYEVAAGRFWSWEQMDEFLSRRSLHKFRETWRQGTEKHGAKERLHSMGQMTIEDFK